MRMLLALLITGCSVAGDNKKPPFISRVEAEHVWDTRFGQTVCSMSERTNCGITLWHCTDEMVYHCLLDLREHLDR